MMDAKERSISTLRRKLSAFCGSVGHYSIGHECHLTLSLFADETSETPECSHRITGSGRHNLLLLIGLLGGIILMLGLLKKTLCCLKKI